MQSSLYCQPVPQQPPPDFDMSMTFELVDHCIAYVKRFATNNNFMISLDTKDSRTRGQILCSSKSCGRIKGQHCPFRVNFNKSAQLEMFQFTKDDFNHSHPLNEPKMMVDGKEYVKHQRDLKDSEVACIEQLSLCYLFIPMFQTCLERIFPGRAFDKCLLTRMSNKYLDQKLGKDRHNLPILSDSRDISNTRAISNNPQMSVMQ
jgi:hypothetical protein